MKQRLILLFIFCGVIGSGVITRGVYLQLVKDARLETLARKQFQSRSLIRPRRGPIVDRNGEALAINIESQSLAANPMNLKSRKRLSNLLSKVFGLPQSKVLEKLSEPKEFVWIKRHLNDTELKRIKKLQFIDDDGDFSNAVWLVRESKRAYPHGRLAGQVLGYVNPDTDGIEGVELWQNENLRGKVVSMSAIKDALGRPTFIDAEAVKQVKDGEPIELSIDASLQFEVEELLHNSVAKHNAKGGSVIVMNALNGEVLAMANEPYFDPNDRNAPIDRRRNRVLTDGYEPGSTMKAVLLSSALSNGLKLSEQIYAEKGSFYVQGKKISEAEAHEKFGYIDLKKMIQVSSNVGAAKLALKVGPDAYFNTLKSFEFGSKTQTGFPGEISGRVPPRKNWSPLTTANIGFGQGVLVTPMQMARAYAAFINGGWLVQPTLIKEKHSNDRTVAPKRVIAASVADDVLRALETVTVDPGTGLKANLEGYRVAGKTGTAQVVDSATRRYSRSHYRASFIGFPLETDMKLVILTMIDEPKGVYYASETAAPLFREVLSATVNRFNIPATVKLSPQIALKSSIDKIKSSSAKSISKPTQEIVLPESARKPVYEGARRDGSLTYKMPNLIGLNSREAIRALTGKKFELRVKGAGWVKSQSPEPGQAVAEGESIRLQLAE